LNSRPHPANNRLKLASFTYALTHRNAPVFVEPGLHQEAVFDARKASRSTDKGEFRKLCSVTINGLRVARVICMTSVRGNRLNWVAVVVLCFAVVHGAGPAFAGTALQPQVKRLDDIAPKRILFVGNSYLYYNDSVHNHVRRIAEENGPHKPVDYQYKSATIGGARLSHHFIESLLQRGRLGIDKPFDLVILQGGSGEVLTVQSRRAFANTAAEMAVKIRRTKAEVALYMTPAYVQPHEDYDPDMIDKIVRTYVKTGNELGALVIPVGLAFDLAYERRPDIVLHKTFDGTHPSMLGTYLAACVVYASVYQKPVTNIRYDYFGAVGEDEARFLRAIADETVREFYK